MKTKISTTLAAVLLSLNLSWADGTDIDGICYRLDGSKMTASVTYTSWFPFSGNSYAGSITIPASVTYDGKTYSVRSIGRDAFYGCTGLASIDIPASVTAIGENAFYGCTGLVSIDLPASITLINRAAFYGCTGLASISIPASVTVIGDAVFRGCTSLVSIDLPASITLINSAAFEDCTSLTSISIPASVTSIGELAFGRCTSLTSIRVDAGNTVYDSREGCNAIIETSSNKLVVGCKTTVIPISVTFIDSGAFYCCTGLTRIDIPASVTGIGDIAFSGCTGLKSIDLPASVTEIGKLAFSGCTGLRIFTARRTDPEGYHCHKEAFLNSFTYIATLHVPAGCKELYMSCSPWNEFGTIIDDVTGISRNIVNTSDTPDGNPAFLGNFNLKGLRTSVPLRGVYIKDGRKLMK